MTEHALKIHVFSDFDKTERLIYLHIVFVLSIGCVRLRGLFLHNCLILFQDELIPGAAQDQEALLITLTRPIILAQPQAFDKGERNISR